MNEKKKLKSQTVWVEEKMPCHQSNIINTKEIRQDKLRIYYIE